MFAGLLSAGLLLCLERGESNGKGTAGLKQGRGRVLPPGIACLSPHIHYPEAPGAGGCSVLLQGPGLLIWLAQACPTLLPGLGATVHRTVDGHHPGEGSRAGLPPTSLRPRHFPRRKSSRGTA